MWLGALGVKLIFPSRVFIRPSESTFSLFFLFRASLPFKAENFKEIQVGSRKICASASRKAKQGIWQFMNLKISIFFTFSTLIYFMPLAITIMVREKRAERRVYLRHFIRTKAQDVWLEGRQRWLWNYAFTLRRLTFGPKHSGASLPDAVSRKANRILSSS